MLLKKGGFLVNVLTNIGKRFTRIFKGRFWEVVGGVLGNFWEKHDWAYYMSNKPSMENI